MRLATIVEPGGMAVAVVEGDRCLRLPTGTDGATSIRDIASSGSSGLHRIAAWVDAQPRDAVRPLDEVMFGPVIPDPGAIYTVGLNYRAAGDGAPDPRRARPGRAAASAHLRQGGDIGGRRRGHAPLGPHHRPDVDPEVELGVVIGATATNVSAVTAMDHVFGYTIINDVSSRDAWLDGDQWLLGKSFPGFCPVGPWVVTRDELDPADLRLGCRLGDQPMQEGRTSQMRASVPEIIAFLSRHVTLRPGDLIATGTPPRFGTTPPVRADTSRSVTS